MSATTEARALALSLADAPTWARLANHERIAARAIVRAIDAGDHDRARSTARNLAESMGAVPWRECPPGAWLVAETHARRLAAALASTPPACASCGEDGAARIAGRILCAPCALADAEVHATS